MATVDNNTLQSSANLSLWFKIYTNDSLSLADIPEVIPLRWTYFKENWIFLKRQMVALSDDSFDPDYFRAAIDDLTTYIEKQRLNTTDTNPFSASSVYYRFYPIFDNIRLESITLTNEERTLIANKIAVIEVYSKSNFLDIKKNLREFRNHLADLVGLNDPDFDRVYNRAPIRPQTDPSIGDLNLMLVMEKQLSTIDFILSNLFAVDNAIDPFALARQNANNVDINIGQYKSGKLVKLNFKEDLASLAKRYFGNADKWIDIAIANGLKDPYIDEVGQQLFFLTNGSSNQINFSSKDTFGNDNLSKFFINQLILIQSDTIPFPSQRTITGIKQIPLSNEIILTVSDSPNMGDYLLSANASIRIFKPNTINSSQYILIPTESPLPSVRSEEIPWFLSGKSSDEKNTKIDFAVGTDGSLLRNTTGDLALSYGLDNAVQAIKAKMLTELGSNRRHPGYGLINLVGTSTTQTEEAKNALITSVNSQITSDGRFDRVQSLNVTKNTTTDAVAYDVTLVVKLAGSKTFLPITFTVNT